MESHTKILHPLILADWYEENNQPVKAKAIRMDYLADSKGFSDGDSEDSYSWGDSYGDLEEDSYGHGYGDGYECGDGDGYGGGYG